MKVGSLQSGSTLSAFLQVSCPSSRLRGTDATMQARSICICIGDGERVPMSLQSCTAQRAAGLTCSSALARVGKLRAQPESPGQRRTNFQFPNFSLLVMTLQQRRGVRAATARPERTKFFIAAVSQSAARPKRHSGDMSAAPTAAADFRSAIGCFGSCSIARYARPLSGGPPSCRLRGLPSQRPSSQARRDRQPSLVSPGRSSSSLR